MGAAQGLQQHRSVPPRAEGMSPISLIRREGRVPRAAARSQMTLSFVLRTRIANRQTESRWYTVILEFMEIILLSVRECSHSYVRL